MHSPIQNPIVSPILEINLLEVFTPIVESEESDSNPMQIESVSERHESF
jgi:hypothetical protein